MKLLEVPFEHSLAVIHHGQVIHHSGDLSRLYWLASVTKVIATRAALVAVDRGMLSLDQPVGLPGATVRHLLAHASGMEADHEKQIVPAGKRRIYSNAGIELLGRLVEQATATDLPAWIEETVLDPLGMSSTYITGSPAHSGKGTVEDLVALAQELLHPRLVSASLDRQATTSVFPDLKGILPGYGRQDPNTWGLGVEIRSTKSPHWTAPEASPETFGHFGMSGSFIWVDRPRDAAAVFLGAENFGEWHHDHWATLNHQILEQL